MKKIFDLINENIERLNLPFVKKDINQQLPIITISREKRAGGRTTAYLVVKKLGGNWQVYHKEIIDRIAKESKLEKKLIEEIDEKKLSFVDALINDFFGKRYMTLSSYQKHLVKIISEIAHRGYAIIVGRGAEYLIPHALKVRIIGDMEQRIKWAMEYDHLTRKEAIEWLKKLDKERNEFIKTLYNHDPKKAHHYDLVIKIGPNFSIEDAADLIVLAAKRRFKLR
jgi:cytidylate kinase